MPLHFPNLQTLRLALSSGAVPEAIAAAPLEATFGEEGEILVQARGKLPPGASTKLKALGVSSTRTRLTDAETFCCWHQLLPVEKVAGATELTEKSVVLFELQEAKQLPELVDEMLRLGNDRQAFRHVQAGDSLRTLLRVTGAPYYSLLRAIDGHAAQNGAPVAYVEQSPRVWVQLGYHHATAGTIQPPPGQMLFVRPPRDWKFLNEAPLADIYSVLDVQLPQQPAAAHASELDQKLQVPLRMVAGGAGDAAELWVLTKNAIEQVERFVCAADDRLLARLSFAVSQGENPTVVLRARPSKQALPVLVLDALACRTHLKLSNLFVPVGSRLHPPLRRDVVAKLLAPDKERLVWLEPDADASADQSGSFVPRSLPDSAFRPLHDWVDYIVESDTAAMDAWVSAHRFDFEPFVCKDDSQADKKPPKRGKPAQRELPPEDRDRPRTVARRPNSEVAEHIEVEELAVALPTAKKGSSAERLRKALVRIEEQFHASDEPLESPQRADLWRQMAVANAALSHRLDATICWVNGLWEERKPPAKLLSSWLQCEKQTAGIVEIRSKDLDALTADNAATPNHANMIAALLVQAAHSKQPPPMVTSRIDVLSRYIQRQENHMPIRAAWLAWDALVKLSHGDVLALARARDRLLERLYQSGMLAEFDLASFMRAGGGVEAKRLKGIRDFLVSLHTVVRRWIAEPVAGQQPQTGAYADMMFAFAMARLGESARADVILQEAAQKLSNRDGIHKWLGDAFTTRIIQALQGASEGQRLDEALLVRLERMEKLDRYKVDRLRQQSRILEPYERIDPYRRWHGRYSDELSRQLAELFDENNREKLSARLGKLVQNSLASNGKQDLPRVLATALELSPRLGSDAAQTMLAHLPAALASTSDVVERALLLEKGLHIAAHFDEVETVHICVEQFEKSLADIVQTYFSLQIKFSADSKEKLDTLDALFMHSLKGLRKLGMRDDIGRLFGNMASLVHGQSTGKKKKADDQQARRMGLLLAVISGQYYFGQHQQADSIADEVRDLLLAGQLPPVEQKNLACGYIRAVAQAPAETSLPRIQELFEMKKGEGRKLSGISDAMTTSSHYSLSQLNVIEAALLALVSDDFTMSDETRRWLDEDEYLVRRRIHADVKHALDAAGA